MDKQRHLDELFRLAQQDRAAQSFEQTKNRFVSSLHASVNKPATKQVVTKKWIIMLAAVSTISLSLFLLLGNGAESTPHTKSEKTSPEREVQQPLPVNSAPIQTPDKQREIVPAKHTPFLASVQELVTHLPLTQENLQTEIPGEKPHDYSFIFPKYKDEDPYQFPKLTEEEIAVTKKKKKAMLKALIKYDKSAYAYIPSGSFDYNGQQVSVQAFYMRTVEVTNFEYRTFLFDLLIQDRKNEFLKAKPDQQQWNSIEGLSLQRFAEYYFYHKAYNEYPVVNISREGAELYCKWLSEEMRKSVGEEKESKFNDVRLPLRVEWVKAASNEGNMQPYPWGGPFTRDRRGLIQANYARTEEEITKEEPNPSPYVNLDVTAPSKSYWPNPLGLYNISGNVAEMVYEGVDKSEPGTAGGSWRNSAEEIKIYAPDPYKGITGPKPTIGFRVVSTYLMLDHK